jgi:hypothetical protein
VLRILSDLKASVVEIAAASGTRTGASQKIETVVDIDFIKAQLDAEAFSWKCCQKLFIDVMSILSEFHSAKTAWLDIEKKMSEAEHDDVKRPDAFCEALHFIKDHITAIRRKVLNYKLNTINVVNAII